MNDSSNSAAPLASHTLELTRKSRQILIAEMGPDGKPIPKGKVDIALAAHQLVVDVHLVSDGKASPESAGRAVITAPSETVHITLESPDGKGGLTKQTADIVLEQHSFMIVPRFKLA